MKTLKELQAIGAVSASAVEQSFRGVKSIHLSDALRLPDSQRENLKKVVIVDNARWMATYNGEPPREAKSVLSCNAQGVFGVWNKEHREFSLMKLATSRLQTYKKIKLVGSKEEIQKALEFLESKLPENNNYQEVLTMNKEGNPIDPSAAFSQMPTSAPGAAEPAPEKAKSTRGQKSELVKSVRKTIENVETKDYSKIWATNFAKGRLIAFVTPADDVIKVTTKAEPVLDDKKHRVVAEEKRGEYEEYLAKDPATAKAIQNGDKQIPKIYCEKTKELMFINSRPGQPEGIIISVPASTDYDVSDLLHSADATAASSDDVMNIKFLEKEQAFAYLSANFGDKIREDQDLLGAKASTITVQHRVVENKSKKDGTVAAGSPINVVRNNFKLESGSPRKGVLTEGNFFPKKVYRTTSLDNLTPEMVSQLNLLYEREFGGSAEKYAQYSDATKAKVKFENNKVTSDVFNNGGSIEVLRFDKANENDYVTDVRVPLIEKKFTKEGKPRYVYQTAAAGAEGGPQTMPKYNAIIKKTGLTEEEFINKLQLTFNKKKGSKSTGVNNLETADFIALLSSNQHAIAGLKKDINALSVDIMSANF